MNLSFPPAPAHPLTDCTTCFCGNPNDVFPSFFSRSMWYLSWGRSFFLLFFFFFPFSFFFFDDSFHQEKLCKDDFWRNASPLWPFTCPPSHIHSAPLKPFHSAIQTHCNNQDTVQCRVFVVEWMFQSSWITRFSSKGVWTRIVFPCSCVSWYWWTECKTPTCQFVFNSTVYLLFTIKLVDHILTHSGQGPTWKKKVGFDGLSRTSSQISHPSKPSKEHK